MIFQRMIGDQRNHKQIMNNANIAENILISPLYVVKTSFQVDIEIYEDKFGKSGDRIHSSHITNDLSTLKNDIHHHITKGFIYLQNDIHLRPAALVNITFFRVDKSACCLIENINHLYCYVYVCQPLNSVNILKIYQLCIC